MKITKRRFYLFALPIFPLLISAVFALMGFLILDIKNPGVLNWFIGVPAMSFIFWPVYLVAVGAPLAILAYKNNISKIDYHYKRSPLYIAAAIITTVVILALIKGKDLTKEIEAALGWSAMVMGVGYLNIIAFYYLLKKITDKGWVIT